MKTLLATTKISTVETTNGLTNINCLMGLASMVRGSGFGRGGLVKIELEDNSLNGNGVKIHCTFGNGQVDTYLQHNRISLWVQVAGSYEAEIAKAAATKKGFRK